MRSHRQITKTIESYPRLTLLISCTHITTLFISSPRFGVNIIFIKTITEHIKIICTVSGIEIKVKYKNKAKPVSNTDAYTYC